MYYGALYQPIKMKQSNPWKSNKSIWIQSL